MSEVTFAEHHLRLQVFDPSGVQDVDVDPTLPALFVRITHPDEARALKRALLRTYPRHHRLQMVRAAGARPASRQTIVQRLDRLQRFHDLAAIYVPPLPMAQAASSLRSLRQLVAYLRGPDGCPWDREQTQESLAPFAVEEAYEAVEAIEQQDQAHLREELGDLLLQVLMQAQIAAERDEFDLTDVMSTLGTKLVRRHPHVFGSTRAGSAAEVLQRWDDLKAEERGKPDSALGRVPKSQPALRIAQELQKRASRSGFDWPTRSEIEAKVREEVEELLAASGPEQVRAELGDLLFILAKLGLSWDVDAEMALRAANDRFTTRFQFIERTLKRRGQKIQSTSLEELLQLWQQAKRAEGRRRKAVGGGP